MRKLKNSPVFALSKTKTGVVRIWMRLSHRAVSCRFAVADSARSFAYLLVPGWSGRLKLFEVDAEQFKICCRV